MMDGAPLKPSIREEEVKVHPMLPRPNDLQSKSSYTLHNFKETLTNLKHQQTKRQADVILNKYNTNVIADRLYLNRMSK